MTTDRLEALPVNPAPVRPGGRAGHGSIRRRPVRPTGFGIYGDPYRVYTHRVVRRQRQDDEPFIARSLKFPPSLWDELEEAVPPGRRSEFVREAVRHELARRREAGPLSSWVQGLLAEVPDEELSRLPADLCDQLDHYVYDTPRRGA